MTHLCLSLVLCAAPVPVESKGTMATIFVARKVVTMERRQATATAVAVVGDRVVAVGTLDEVQAATRRYKTQIDRTFADKVILPGFVALLNQGGPLLPAGPLLRGGVTTAAEVSGRDLEDEELVQLKAARDAGEVPFRTFLLPQGGRPKTSRKLAYLDAVVLTHADAGRIGQIHWNGGYQLLVRGDPDASLDVLAKVQKQARWDDHRFTVLLTDKWSAAQCEHLGKLGGLAVLDPRTSPRAGTFLKNKVPPALYCVKEAVAPLALLSELSGGEDRVSVIDALRMVTANAAFVLRQEKNVGSIAPGKKADFVVLEQDPLGVPLKQLKDVAVWGTVFEGKKHPARQAVGWDERPKRLADRPSGSTLRHVSGLFGDDADPRRGGKCDPSCPCRGGPRSKTPPLNPIEPRRGR
jgi:hypothetical protein